MCSVTLDELLVLLSKGQIFFFCCDPICSHLHPSRHSLPSPSFVSSLFLYFPPISLQRLCHFFHFKNDSTFLRYSPYLHSKTPQKTCLCQIVSLPLILSLSFFPPSYSLLNPLQLGFPVPLNLLYQ